MDYVERYSAFSFDGAGTNKEHYRLCAMVSFNRSFTEAGKAYCNYGNPTAEYVAGNAVNQNRKDFPIGSNTTTP